VPPVSQQKGVGVNLDEHSGTVKAVQNHRSLAPMVLWSTFVLLLPVVRAASIGISAGSHVASNDRLMPTFSNRATSQLHAETLGPLARGFFSQWQPSAARQWKVLVAGIRENSEANDRRSNAARRDQEKQPSAAQNAAAGAIAGFTARMAVAPVDLAKIRLQLQQGRVSPTTPLKYRGMIQTMTTVAKEEGFLALWKGNIPAQLMGACARWCRFFPASLSPPRPFPGLARLLPFSLPHSLNQPQPQSPSYFCPLTSALHMNRPPAPLTAICTPTCKLNHSAHASTVMTFVAIKFSAFNACRNAIERGSGTRTSMTHEQEQLRSTAVNLLAGGAAGAVGVARARAHTHTHTSP
jgi:hypothetical protein